LVDDDDFRTERFQQATVGCRQLRVNDDNDPVTTRGANHRERQTKIP